jgi:two-component system CheB/CheR fusion protein
MGLKIDINSELEEKIIAVDVDSIERILLNLLSNAIKFTEKGGSVSVNISDKNEFISISVKDTGIGIPVDKQNLIFKRFVQVNRLLTREREGSGIGLTLVKDLVNMHQGNIYVVSEVGKGSEFFIELPSRTIEIKDNENEQWNIENSYDEKVNIEFSDIY